MNGNILSTVSRSLATVAVASLLAACAADTIIAVEQDQDQEADLRNCTNLHAPAGTEQTSHLYATGVQIYRWNDTSWVFVAPSAVLTTDAAGASTVGIHYAGPTWQGVTGSKVVGTVLDRCTANASAIPWLLLTAVSTDGPGVFQGATYIQRLNTTGGLTPTVPGSATGEVRSVPYTAEYRFYRPQ